MKKIEEAHLRKLNMKLYPSIYTMTNIYWNIARVIITAIGSFVLTLVDVKYGYNGSYIYCNYYTN